MFQNVYYSFFDWNGLGMFTGLKMTMFTDRVIGRSMINTGLWVAFTLVLPATGGLLVAVFTQPGAGSSSIFFIPLTISFVATGVIWAYMFSKESGVFGRAPGDARHTVFAFVAHLGSLEHVRHDPVRMDLAADWGKHGHVPHGAGDHSPEYHRGLPAGRRPAPGRRSCT